MSFGLHAWPNVSEACCFVHTVIGYRGLKSKTQSNQGLVGTLAADLLVDFPLPCNVM